LTARPRMDGCALDPEHLERVVRDTWGPRCQLRSLEDLNDGFAKKTYRLGLSHSDSRCILHVWEEPDHQLTCVETDADWLLGPSGSDLFAVNNEFLRRHGVATPELYALDGSRTVCDYDFALVEFIEGCNFTEFTRRCDDRATQALLARIDAQLRTMHALRAPQPGRLDGRRSEESRCERLVEENTRLSLDLACEFNETIKTHRTQILDTLQSLIDIIEPRSTFHLIHGELGPEHILVSPSSESYFIDCEGVRYFDLEYEHSLLRARFGPLYSAFSRDDLDPHRMNLYTLTHSIGWTAFASEAVAGDSIDREWATGVMTSNTRRVIELVEGR